MKIGKISKNVGLTIMLPVIAYLFFMILCNATGHPGFGVGGDLQTIIYNAVYVTLIAEAMTINLQTGRFDFAMGATLVLSTIAGGSIAKALNAGPVGMLVIILVLGIIAGVISGVVYVALRLPPMVVSLGIAMLYEAIGFIISNSGIRFDGEYTGYLVYAKFPVNLILMVVVLAILVIIYDFSSIGYNRKALQSGQKIAVDVGIREGKNAIICYAIAGALLALAGCVNISYFGYMGPSTGLGSSAYFANAFLPMFIGAIFAKYSSQPFAVFMGGLVQACIDSGLARLNVDSSLQTIITGVVVCVFLIYSSNAYKIVEIEMFKKKLAKANAARKAGN